MMLDRTVRRPEAGGAGNFGNPGNSFLRAPLDRTPRVRQWFPEFPEHSGQAISCPVLGDGRARVASAKHMQNRFRTMYGPFSTIFPGGRHLQSPSKSGVPPFSARLAPIENGENG